MDLSQEMTAIERFLSKMRISNVHFYEGTACWEYLGSKNKNGYGEFWDSGRTMCHRFIYEYYYGAIDPNLHVHHLCYNPSCCNVLHLKQLTRRENILDGNSPPAINARKTHCKNGHKYNEKNTYTHNGHSECRICKKEYVRTHQEQVMISVKRYRERNREKIKLRMKEYRKTNKENE